MKLKVLFLVGALAISAGASGGVTFCDGVRNGWQDVWKDAGLGPRVVPMCPMDTGGFGDVYNRGYRKGAAQAIESICKSYPLKCK